MRWYWKQIQQITIRRCETRWLRSGSWGMSRAKVQSLLWQGEILEPLVGTNMKISSSEQICIGTGNHCRTAGIGVKSSLWCNWTGLWWKHIVWLFSITMKLSEEKLLNGLTNGVPKKMMDLLWMKKWLFREHFLVRWRAVK